MTRTLPRTPIALLAIAALTLALVPPTSAVADEDPLAPVVVNEMATRGPSGASDNFVELRNVSDEPVDISGWQIQRCNNTGTGFVGTQVTVGSHVMAPGDYYLVAHATAYSGSTTPDATYPISISDDGGARIIDADGQVVDGVGFGTNNNNCTQGTPPPQLTTAQGNAGMAYTRDADGTNTGDNATDFSLAERTPTASGGGDEEQAVQVTCPSGMRTVESYATDGQVAASYEDGEVTSLEITDVAPAPASGELVLEDVTTGGTASATLVVPDDLVLHTPTSTAEVGPLSVEITASADDGETGTCIASVDVIPLVPIGAVQGVIADGQTSFTSPLLNATVAVEGVVTQVTREGSGDRGFFLQNTPAQADGDPASSDGIFLFNGGFTTVRTDFDGPANADVGANWNVTVGDQIVLRGTVQQFFGNTQFGGGSSFVWDVTGDGLDVDAVVDVTEIDPPDDAGDSLRYFRRHLGMQMQVPAGSAVVNGRDVFSGTDAEVWAIRGDHPVAQRDDPFAARVFRDAHPLDNNPDTLFDDDNGYRFVLGSFGLKGAADDPDAVLAPARSFDTIENSPRGGVYLSFGKYTVNVEEQIDLVNGVDPADNHPVQPADREREHAVAAYNVENLYDTRDNPNSGCDTPDGPGCPGVSPPFNYLPDSEEDYQHRLQGMAEQIRIDLHAPDVVMIQETEAQDVCTVSEAWDPDWDPASTEDRLDCDLVNTGDDNTRSDGRPDSLLELALVIAEQGGPTYDAVFDLDSGDARGITIAYLYRTDRVELLEPDPSHPVLGADPTIDYDGEPLAFNSDVENPKALNAAQPERLRTTCQSSGARACDGVNVFSRAPQVGAFRVWRDGIGTSVFSDVYLINNHQSAGPANRVFQRREQATYNALIAEAILDVDADARVLVGGDLNVFPRPDDPYRPGDTIAAPSVCETLGIGVDACTGPSDQLEPLYESPLTNLYGWMLERYPTATYTFGFQGQAQTLDHLWVSSTLLDELIDARSAKINVDWPALATGEVPAYGRFGISDHDPEVGRFDLAVSFERVRELVEWLAAEGQLDAATADSILDRLANAEGHLAAGRDRAARAQLESIAATLRGLAADGEISQAVADGLTAEVRLLLP